MFWHCQHRGDTMCFSLSCPVLWANPSGSQCSPRWEEERLCLAQQWHRLPGEGQQPWNGGWRLRGEHRGAQVLEQARIKAAESINLPVRQDNFIHMLIVLGKTRTSPWAFPRWVFQGGADLPKQTLVLVLRLLKSSVKLLVHFKPLLALT